MGAMRKDFLGLIVVVAIFVAGGTILMQSKILPEERAQDFRTLENISLQSQVQMIQEPTAGDNTYIYAINEVARESWEIAKKDPRVQAIVDGARGKALTVAAVQPSAFVSPEGKVTHSGLGQVIITANWQTVDGRPYSAKSFSSIDGKQGQSRQQIWNVAVDLDQDRVISIQDERERVMTETLRTNVVYGGVNMYLPEVVITEAGSTVRWINESSLQHNVVGTYRTESGAEEKIDSGFFKTNEDWERVFSEKGTFDYHCTIHAEEGMKGRLVIS
jgi:plastocyanin